MGLTSVGSAALLRGLDVLSVRAEYVEQIRCKVHESLASRAPGCALGAQVIHQERVSCCLREPWNEQHRLAAHVAVVMI